MFHGRAFFRAELVTRGCVIFVKIFFLSLYYTLYVARPVVADRYISHSLFRGPFVLLHPTPRQIVRLLLGYCCGYLR